MRVDVCFCVYVLCVSKTHTRVLFNEGSPDWSQVWTCGLPIIPPTPAQGAKVSKKVRSFNDSWLNVSKIIIFKCLVVTTKTKLTFVNGLSLLFYLVSCMSAVEANKVCLAVLLANSSMDMLAYRGQTALLKKTFV